MHRALVDRAKQGDVEAFDALARLVGDRCMGIARRILRDRDRAEDAVQGALLTAWRELRTLRDADRFEPWLHRIVVNECYAEARRQRRWSVDIHVLPTDGRADPGEYLTVNDRDQLERGFRRLTLEQRSVLVFYHYLGLTLTEVADALVSPSGPRSPGSITPRMHSGRAFRPTTGRHLFRRSDWHDHTARPRPPHPSFSH